MMFFVSNIAQRAEQRRRERLQAEKARLELEGSKTLKRTIRVRQSPTAADIDRFLTDLKKVQDELAIYADMEITIELDEGVA